MTLEEHVDNICNWKHNAGLRNAVLEEMRDLIKDCARICAEGVGDRQFNDPFSREGETVRRIVHKIRALAAPDAQPDASGSIERKR